MKSVVIRTPGKGIEAWALAERPAPTPGPGEVLVRIRAASLNYRDLMIARNLYGGPPREELIALSDGAGEIVAVGSEVKRWKVGDRVAGAYYPDWVSGPIRPEHVTRTGGARATDGVLAELAVFAETAVVRVPSHLSFEQASTLPCAAVTAWSVLMEPAPRLAPGSTVVVFGTGGVSVFAAQIAIAAGLRVIATSSSDDKIARLRELGVRDTIQYRSRPDWEKEVLRLTDGRGADLVVDVGGAATLPKSFEATRVGGTVSLIGVLTGLAEQVNPLPVLFKNIKLEGISVGSVASFENMNRAIEQHRLVPVIDEVFPMDRAPEALRKLEAGTHFGKIVVRVD